MYLHFIILVGADTADLATPGSDTEAVLNSTAHAQDPGALADWLVATARENSGYFSGWMPAAAAQAGDHQLSLRAYPPTFQ
jgi:hypothetical protein